MVCLPSLHKWRGDVSTSGRPVVHVSILDEGDADGGLIRGPQTRLAQHRRESNPGTVSVVHVGCFIPCWVSCWISLIVYSFLKMKSQNVPQLVGIFCHSYFKRSLWWPMGRAAFMTRRNSHGCNAGNRIYTTPASSVILSQQNSRLNSYLVAKCPLLLWSRQHQMYHILAHRNCYMTYKVQLNRCQEDH